MKKIFASLLMLSITSASFAQDVVNERIKTAYAAAFGRQPQDGELAYWRNPSENKDKNLTLQQMIEAHRRYMNDINPAEEQNAIKQALRDALGREASEAELRKYTAKRLTYSEIVQELVDWLKERNSQGFSEYDEVIRKAYKTWFNENLSKAKLNEYKKQPVKRWLSWYHEFEALKTGKPLSTGNSQRRIQSTRGLYLTVNFITISASLLPEAKLITTLPCISVGGGNWIGTNTGNVISTGGGNIIGQDSGS